MKNKHLLFTFLLLMGITLSCNQTPKKQQTETQSEDQSTFFIEQGLEIAGVTQAAMSTQLKTAMQTGGVPNAVQYCNVRAYPIADSLAQVYDASIHRRANQARNPENKIQSDLEQQVFDLFQERWDTEEKMRPIIRDLNGEEVAFFAPIMAQELCLNCHGTLGETLTAQNYEHIKQLYPDDAAIGYTAGDLRGMWYIVMKKQ